MKKNKVSLKQRLRNGEGVLGTWNIIPSSSLINTIGSSGIDFIVIDAEHGPANMVVVEDLIRAAEVSGMASIVRVPSNESHLVLRALDIGAYGVQIPHVSTKKEAELAVEYSKYYPEGSRGLSPFTRAGNYGKGAEDHTVRANENTLVVLNIEGTEGIKNLEEIVEVPNVDVIFLGPYDLSQSIGKPGQVNDPEVRKLMKDSVRSIKENGRACGSFAKDKDYLEFLIDCGVQYLTYMVDTSVILEAYSEINRSYQKMINYIR
ncbi:MAG: hypothetical protein A2W05_00050 [Candidatus Schekmanbacteria bacterium RBG_16_38_10]|uniref:HpcH/HpaI aldolase/citrate lyase domain-containing protein n=1 Tax=Candidatus Schekmanbacteria bacterium RBG_16_38_10 TaxID=1817879 RepID=A0A1F7S1J0_9BACT|nr:MAG: hypothetical protein A2W05_00050 [Candidatus Schekmanbacteria bacterium RBG_16_38_10]